MLGPKQEAQGAWFYEFSIEGSCPARSRSAGNRRRNRLIWCSPSAPTSPLMLKNDLYSCPDGTELKPDRRAFKTPRSGANKDETTGIECANQIAMSVH